MYSSFGAGLGVALPLARVFERDRVGLLVGGYKEGEGATTAPSREKKVKKRFEGWKFVEKKNRKKNLKIEDLKRFDWVFSA